MLQSAMLQSPAMKPQCGEYSPSTGIVQGDVHVMSLVFAHQDFLQTRTLFLISFNVPLAAGDLRK